MLAARRLLTAWLLAAALAAPGLLAGCRKAAGDRPIGEGDDRASAQSVRQSLDGLTNELRALTAKFVALREKVEAVPPEVPGFREARARFYAIEEGRGTMDGKAAWLSARLDAAASTGNRQELQQVEKEIARTYREVRQIEQLHVELLHQMMAFQRVALQEQAAGGPTPPLSPVARARPRDGARPRP